jgi:hypothetical protein
MGGNKWNGGRLKEGWVYKEKGLAEYGKDDRSLLREEEFH